MVTKNKVNILIVDDRPENIMALEAVLDSEDYYLVAAHSGEEALKYVLQYDFAVILLDVQMPGLNGFETAEIIKQREQSNHIPIIFVTALSKANEHVSTGYSTGAVDYIFKPYNPIILRSKVEAFVQIYKKQIEIKQKNLYLEQQFEQLKDKQNNLEVTIEEKTAELVLKNKELQVSEERFKKIFRHSPNLMAIRSLKTSQYLDVNESWKQFTGYDLTEIQGPSLDILKIKGTAANNARVHHPIPYDLMIGIYNVEITYVTKNNKIRDGLISTETANINGEECIISTITDVTEMVQLEREITRLDRLNLVGEMAAGIAHEIRNPMTTVLGFLQLAKNQQETQPHEYVNLMIDELNRANGIITEFLTLAKDKANDRRQKSLNTIIKTLHPLLRAEALLDNKEVSLELTECPLLFLDEKEIRQLILNIGLNGLEAMAPGGRLEIKTFVQNEYVVLEIKDEGPGINKEILANIGTPFFTTKEKGTGLGLAICYSIASRHSAHIDIQTSNKGTSFLIHFVSKQ